jgi:LuxR family maltose regulon positive regulatory protein
VNRTGAEIFLKTKLIRPWPRVERVIRPRLLRLMDRVFTAPLTLVCAPAGYGKTTLLASWVETCPAPVAWLSLEEGENDPERFLNYLILALQQIAPGMGKGAQVTFGLPGRGMLENNLRLLVNDMAGLSEPAVLVLDDYHLIRSRQVHGLMGFLVEHLPPAFHLIIASRTQPPLSIARLRGRSTVLELRASDLSFQSDEVEAFLNQVMDLHLSKEACRQVEKRTEGWAAALQLVALSMQSGESGITTDAFGSGLHFIFDYLADEVLRHLPEPMQRFLMHTAILDRASGPLCDALVEPFAPCASGAECLETLEHANLFTQALDGEHRWYRYHALFADFLRERLKQTQPEVIPELHSRAARWLAAQGSFEEACKHAQAGKNEELLVWLIETYAEQLEKMGELAILERWINLLPDHVIRSHARVSLARAWISAARLDVHTASTYLDAVEQALQEDDSPSIRSEAMAARAFIAGVSDQPEEVRSYTERAFRQMPGGLPGEKHFLVGLLMINKSFPLIMSGRLKEAIDTLEDATAAGIESNSAIIVLLAMRLLGEAYMMNGRLSQAEQVFLDARKYIEKQLDGNSLIDGMALMGLGEVLRQRNDLAKAEVYLEDGLKKTLVWMPAMALDGFLWLAALKQALGHGAEAQNLLRQALQVNATNTFPLLDGWFIGIAAVRMDVLQGYLEAGLRWAESTGLDMKEAGNLDRMFPGTPPPFREMAFYVMARLFLVLGRREKVAGALENAKRILDYTLPFSEQAGMYTALIEGLLILAQVEQALGHAERAQEHLHRALDLAAPEQPLRIFLDEGEPVAALLAERRSLPLPVEERAFIEVLWAAWENEPRKPAAPPQAPSPVVGGRLLEPLSFREVEVLRWMAGGKSNQEIADGLVLSLNTVKKHVSTIIAKLGAKNRVQAVITARQMRILE